jgi:hypothetical protein
MGYFLRCHRLHENCVSQSTHKVVTSCFPHSDVCCCVSRRTGPNSPRVISGVLSSQAMEEPASELSGETTGMTWRRGSILNHE